MAKVSRITDQSGEEISWAFDCPACGIGHALRTQSPDGARPVWSFNDDAERPTFRPSLLVRWGKGGEAMGAQVCHSFITNGEIRFLSDCTHALAGHTVEMGEEEADAANDTQ